MLGDCYLIMIMASKLCREHRSFVCIFSIGKATVHVDSYKWISAA